jgi:mono/diheme cytochrome c family protein
MRAALAVAGVVASAGLIATARAADGAAIYADTCQACHQEGGVGAPGLAPPLVSPILANAAARQKDYPALVVVRGLTGSLTLAGGTVFSGAMPPQQALSDEEVAAVVTYVFGLNHATATLTAADVARVRSQGATNEGVKQLRLDLAK